MCLNYIAWKFRLADLSFFQIRTYAVYRFFCIRRKILNRRHKELKIVEIDQQWINRCQSWIVHNFIVGSSCNLSVCSITILSYFSQKKNSHNIQKLFFCMLWHAFYCVLLKTNGYFFLVGDLYRRGCCFHAIL